MVIKKFGDLTLREIANLDSTCCAGDCPLAMSNMLCINFPTCPVDMMNDMADDFDIEVVINEP